MNRISAAENLVIQTEPGQWRLLHYGEDGDATTVLEGNTGSPLYYEERFAASHHLPRGGTLPVEYIQQVVLGWSHDDDAWHLGLVLARDLATARGSRWCALAHWPDPDPNVFGDIADEAGKKLAAVLDRPFTAVPPRTTTAQQTPPPPPPPLPALPINLGMWEFNRRDDKRLELKRSRRWTMSRITRIIWYSLLVAIYVFLSMATLRADLALPNAGTMLPNPELLPYLGLIAAVILTGLIFHMMFELLLRPNRIVIDSEARSIKAMRSSRVHWQHTRDDMQALIVTQIVNRRGRKRKLYHGEINLKKNRGKFFRLLDQNDEREVDADSDPVLEETPEEHIQPLTPANVRTDLQAIGLHIATALDDLPCWYDQRVR